MATNLTDIIKKVRTALRGEEVRGSIADGLEYCGQISENAKADMEATASAAKEAMNKTASDAKTTIETSAASTKEQLSKDIDAKAAAALKSIPESYTELDGGVKQVKEDLDEIRKKYVNLFVPDLDKHTVTMVDGHTSIYISKNHINVEKGKDYFVYVKLKITDLTNWIQGYIYARLLYAVDAGGWKKNQIKTIENNKEFVCCYVFTAEKTGEVGFQLYFNNQLPSDISYSIQCIKLFVAQTNDNIKDFVESKNQANLIENVILNPKTVAWDNLSEEVKCKIDRKLFDYEIIFWGDSLTAGAGGDGVTYGAICSNELGITNYLVAGVGGETADSIAARQGGNNAICPVGSVNGTYAVDALKDAFGTSIQVLRQGGANTVNPITVNGIECTLSLSQTSATDSNATYTISGYTGTSIKLPVPIKFSGSTITSDITVIFVGQNGPYYEQRIALIDSMITRTNGKYVIMGLTTQTADYRKSEEKSLLMKYGNHFFNSREMLSQYGMAIMGLTPTETDLSEITQGSVPTSLRSDGVHLNANGYTALGKMLAQHIRSLGYV